MAMWWWWLWWMVVGVAQAMASQCADAQRKCLYRDGCGKALTNYMLWCSDVVRGAPGCSEPCQHALIALTSTREGKDLMDCDCTDDYCLRTKQRVEICRPHVINVSNNETMSCRVSQLICAADAECFTALKYYQRYCRAMFTGKKCSHRCHNSINILRRQEKADKLSNCKCDGLENYDCPRVKANMARLCFHKPKRLDGDSEATTVRQDESPATNEVAAAAPSLLAASSWLVCSLVAINVL